MMGTGRKCPSYRELTAYGEDGRYTENQIATIVTSAARASTGCCGGGCLMGSSPGVFVGVDHERLACASLLKLRAEGL